MADDQGNGAEVTGDFNRAKKALEPATVKVDEAGRHLGDAR